MYILLTIEVCFLILEYFLKKFKIKYQISANSNDNLKSFKEKAKFIDVKIFIIERFILTFIIYLLKGNFIIYFLVTILAIFLGNYFSNIKGKSSFEIDNISEFKVLTQFFQWFIFFTLI